MIKFTLGFVDSHSHIDDMEKFLDFEHKIEKKFKSKKRREFGFPFSATAAIHFEFIAEEQKVIEEEMKQYM